MATAQILQQTLLQLDQRGYKAYQQIRGCYEFPNLKLFIDHVQGDPFASPSRLRVQIPQAGVKGAGFPIALYASHSRAIALKDYLTRQFDRAATVLQEKRGSGKSGLIAIARPGQQVLERTSVWVNAHQVEARFTVGLPARGRQILGHAAAELLCQVIPEIVERSLRYTNLNSAELLQHLVTVEDADALREQLAERGLVAFVANGSVLPRESGISDCPLQEAAIPFQSPASLEVELMRPNQGPIRGMGIPQGITLIVGGGYHGKSTLLRAIALGVYDHSPGDGREGIVTNPRAVKIRAEEGRSIVGVDISSFITHLPYGRSTTSFSTENASGSTSQAANIVEMLEVGAEVLLIDEDTSATNFMIRDRRMQALIPKNQEPITPFIDQVQNLYRDYGVSTILVMGGSGDYFDVADTVIAMSEFQPVEVTEQARAIAASYAVGRVAEGGDRFGPLMPRRPLYNQDANARFERTRLKVRSDDELVLGTEAIDLVALEQIVDRGQVRAIGVAIAYSQRYYWDGSRTLDEIVMAVMADIEAAGWDALTATPEGDLVRFRELELAAAINRLRSLKLTEPHTRDANQQ
jgi:predicted ABC-class ATPase